MRRPTMRGTLLTAALLVTMVASGTAVSAATTSATSTRVHAAIRRHRRHYRNYWQYWHRPVAGNLYTVESVSLAGGSIFSTAGTPTPVPTGELVVEDRAGTPITLNVDNLTRALGPRGAGERGLCQIGLTSLSAGAFVLVRTEVIGIDPLARLATQVVFTGFNPVTTARPVCAIPTPTPTPPPPG